MLEELDPSLWVNREAVKDKDKVGTFYNSYFEDKQASVWRKDQGMAVQRRETT